MAPASDLQKAKSSAIAGRYAIDIGGVTAGWVWSVEGGSATSDVVTEKLGPQHLQGKETAPLAYDTITLTFGTGMSKGFYQWIKDTLDYKHSRKSGAIIGANYDQKEAVRVTFHDALVSEIGFPALVSEIGFPALEASSKDPCLMTLTLTPQRAEIAAAGPSASHGPTPEDAAQQKQWLPSNFRLRIDGLDEPCSKVNKIEALVVKQYQKEGANVEVPNLVITFPESHSSGFREWQESAAKKGGTLEYLAADHHSALFTLSFGGLQVASITPAKVGAGNEPIGRVTVEMYCERITLAFA